MAVEIQIMIPQYGELNRIYSDFIISHTFSFDKQKFITDFYKQYNDTTAFEAAILELVLDKHKEQYTLILNSLIFSSLSPVPQSGISLWRQSRPSVCCVSPAIRILSAFRNQTAAELH